MALSEQYIQFDLLVFFYCFHITCMFVYNKGKDI